MDGAFVGVCVNVNGCSLVLHQLPLTSQIVTDTAYGLESTKRVSEIFTALVTTIQYACIDTYVHNVYFKGSFILLIFYVLS